MSARAWIWAALVAALATGALLFPAGGAYALEQVTFAPAPYAPFGSFSHPTGVALDVAAEEALFASNELASVLAFGLEGGASLGTLSGTGSESFSFEGEPAGVAVDNDPSSPSFHDVYVTDVKHNVVDKFKRTGPGAYEYVCQLNGWYGSGEEACHASGGLPVEPFVEPVGVAVDAQGDVYVSSFGPASGAVDEFDPAGRGVVQVIAAEHPLLVSKHPEGLAIDSSGDLFVQTYEGHRVIEFKRSGFTGAVGLERELTQSATAIAIDSSNDSLYVDLGSVIAVYRPTGAGGLERVAEFGTGILNNSLGMAVDPLTHTVYASDAGGGDATAFLPKLVKVPDLRGKCSASEVTSSAAKLSGEVDPLGLEGAQYDFAYGLTSSYEQQTIEAPLVGTGFRAVAAEVSGLIPGEVYHCRINSTSTEGLAGNLINHGLDNTFQTLPLLPVVNEHPASATEVTTEDAIFNGEVNPGNGPTRYHFAYGLQAGSYANVLPDVAIGSGFAPIAVEQASPPASLKPNTVYHFALIASNAAGTATGHDETFKTASNGVPPESPPAVSTGPAESITPTGAILTGTVYPERTPTTYRFEAGTSTAYGTVLFGGEAGREEGLVRVALALGNLQPGVTFHYRLVAVNAAGTAAGPDRTFVTPSPATGIVQPTTPQLLALPVFPAVKVPLPKPPKPHRKPKKHAKKGSRSRSRRAHGGRARAGARR